MNVQHRELAAGRWREMPLCVQMANIGAEVGRAINWRKKQDPALSQKAAIRALELLDLSFECVRPYAHLREIVRLREAVADYFFGDNNFSSTEASWAGYFDHFNYAARRGSKG